jgi:hypothetical protein
MSKRMVYPLLLLLIPLIFQFPWTLSDFVIGGFLLFVLGLGIELVRSKVQNKNKRYALLALVLFAFVLIWAELAVGLFGTPFAGS